MSQVHDLAWATIEQKLVELVLDREAREKLWQKIVDIRTAERIELTGKLLACQERLDGILDGSFEALVSAKRERARKRRER